MEDSQVQLIVTGDDFGLNPAVNEAVERDHESGWLARTSLMPGESSTAEAIRIARRQSRLKVGLHLALCDGHSLTGWHPLGRKGRLPRDPASVGWTIWCRRGDRDFMAALRREIEAQFAWVRQELPGARHWDAHTHLHLHPVIFPMALSAAKRHRFDEVRVRLLGRGAGWTGAILERLGRTAARQADRARCHFADGVVGLAETGRMDSERMVRALEIIRKIPGGHSIELYYHPGAEPKPLREGLAAWAREKFPDIHWKT